MSSSATASENIGRKSHLNIHYSGETKQKNSERKYYTKKGAHKCLVEKCNQQVWSTHEYCAKHRNTCKDCPNKIGSGSIRCHACNAKHFDGGIRKAIVRQEGSVNFTKLSPREEIVELIKLYEAARDAACGPQQAAEFQRDVDRLRAQLNMEGK